MQIRQYHSAGSIQQLKCWLTTKVLQQHSSYSSIIVLAVATAVSCAGKLQQYHSWHSSIIVLAVAAAVYGLVNESTHAVIFKAILLAPALY